MHSRIFQMSVNPIDKTNYISEDDLPEYFFNEIADYAHESQNSRKDDIIWFTESTCNIFKYINDNKIKLTQKENYFSSRYEYFKETLKALNDITLEDFKRNINLYELKMSADDDYGFYIFDDNGLHTMDDWIRNNSTENTIYYIGTILDYHW